MARRLELDGSLGSGVALWYGNASKSVSSIASMVRVASSFLGKRNNKSKCTVTFRPHKTSISFKVGSVAGYGPFKSGLTNVLTSTPK
jgi:hypothetical protein